jgi:hypothetical protein
VTGWWRIGGGGEYRGREWMRKGRKSSWGGEQWNVIQEREESDGGKNRDKEIVMVKLIIQKTKNRHNYNKKLSLLGKSSGLTSLVSNPGVQD